ncbi:MAG TPA: YetF domain-containing protein [Metabacillus sp.]|nr:YetF domain-containing protein [Metabacillus sp.]
MIGIGSLLVQPLVGKNVWSTLVVGLTLVLTLVIGEYSQIKSDKLEKFISGKAKVLIKDGKLQTEQLKKLRFSVDLLEMKLRQSSVSSLNDVKYATLEPNGQIGFELEENKKPAQKKIYRLLCKKFNN